MVKTTNFVALLLIVFPPLASAGHMSGISAEIQNHWIGYLCLAIFVVAMLAVIAEEFIGMRKSKPMLISAGLIWGLIAVLAGQTGNSVEAEHAVRHNLLQYAELMLIMLVVMTYINAMSERQVFKTLQGWLGHRGYSHRHVFWVTGFASFFLSPVLDNLSTALLMGAVVMAVGKGNTRFIALGCLNVILASNAGGVFSPFGDITTLMVWQQQIHSTNGLIDFWTFFHLFPSALVSYLIPAIAMHFAIPGGQIEVPQRLIFMRRGAKRMMFLFLATIFTAVIFQSLLGLPGVIGILTGLSYLQIFGFYLKKTHRNLETLGIDEEQLSVPVPVDGKEPFDIFIGVARAEWDTLLFLYGVLLSVGGLGYLGYLSLASDLMYHNLGPTTTNVYIGLVSSVLENIPTMSAVLAMAPEMASGQWLLVTLTTGIGGSILSIGSAAGIALMGQTKGIYTFFSHLKWTPFILLGYIAAIELHLQLNGGLF